MTKPSPETAPPKLSTQGKSRQQQRQQRLAAALRANLQRRKAQAAGQAQDGTDSPVPAPKIKT